MPIYVALDRDAMERLRRLAAREYRNPRLQAKLLLEQAIRDRAEHAAPTDDKRTTGSREPEAIAR